MGAKWVERECRGAAGLRDVTHGPPAVHIKAVTLAWRSLPEPPRRATGTEGPCGAAEGGGRHTHTSDDTVLGRRK